ncbi:DMT family transporter [Halobacillus hunanensis]|uniref:DMT family transporter n=1 Tax=Halobacillus hunanensis TaxID=578214 RepID=UPI0009A66CE0|nr:EamA family transporter [Halobacillus hunanensis]
MDKPPFHPYFMLAIGVLSISTSAILVKLASDAPASMIAFYRLALAVIIMLPYVMWKHTHEFKEVSSKEWMLAAFAGIFLASHFILWFESLNYTSVASSVILVSMQPLFAFLGTFLFFKERFTLGALLSMVIAVTGSVIISSGDFRFNGMALLGDILALLGAVMVTAYFLIGQNLRRQLSLLFYTFIVYGIATISLFIYNLALNYSFTGYSSDQWLIFLALAIVPTFLGHTLFNWSLKWMSTSTISMGILLEPVGASILAYMVLDEQITWYQWLGGSIVLFGLVLFIISTKKLRKPKITHLSNNP